MPSPQQVFDEVRTSLTEWRRNVPHAANGFRHMSMGYHQHHLLMQCMYEHTMGTSHAIGRHEFMGYQVHPVNSQGATVIIFPNEHILALYLARLRTEPEILDMIAQYRGTPPRSWDHAVERQAVYDTDGNVVGYAVRTPSTFSNVLLDGQPSTYKTPSVPHPTPSRKTARKGRVLTGIDLPTPPLPESIVRSDNTYRIGFDPNDLSDDDDDPALTNEATQQMQREIEQSMVQGEARPEVSTAAVPADAPQDAWISFNARLPSPGSAIQVQVEHNGTTVLIAFTELSNIRSVYPHEGNTIIRFRGRYGAVDAPPEMHDFNSSSMWRTLPAILHHQTEWIAFADRLPANGMTIEVEQIALAGHTSIITYRNFLDARFDPLSHDVVSFSAITGDAPGRRQTTHYRPSTTRWRTHF